jgi:hypothetical protein
MSQVNRILIIALVAQLLITALVFAPRMIPAGVEGAPLFGAIAAADITTFSVQATDGKRVELARQGESWVVPANDDYPADAAKIDTFLGKIAGLKTNPLVTRTSASHKRLQVAEDDFASRVDFTLADGVTRTLFLGSPASGGTVHIRAGGQDEVYLTRDVTSFDASANVVSWIDPVYLSFTQDNVISFTLQNASGTFEFEKGESNVWAMKDRKASEEFNPDSLLTLIARLSSLRMAEPLGKEAKAEYGLDKPAATVTLTTQSETEGSQTYTLRIGAKDSADNTYVVSSSGSAYYVRVSGFNVEDLVTKTREGFLNLPPTPTPAPTPEITATPLVTSTAEITSTLPVTP